MTDDRKLSRVLFMIQLLAAFLVTAGHYTAGLGSYITVTEWETALNHISRFGTVILAILTGYFTAHSFIGKKTTAVPFFRGKIIYIFLPFIAAGFLYHSVLATTHFPATLNDFLKIVVGRTGGHLYFIFMIMQYYVFAYLFRNWINKKTIWVYLPVFFIIQYAFIQYNFYWRGFGVRYFLPTWIFTIYLGHFFYMYRHAIISFLQKHRAWTYLLVPIAIAGTTFFAFSDKLYTANHLRFVLFTALLIITLVMLLLRIVDRFSIPFVKGLTFYIYLFHPYLIIKMNGLFMRKWEWHWILENKLLSFLYLLLIFGATCVIALIISKAIGFLSRPRFMEQQRKEVAK